MARRFQDDEALPVVDLPQGIPEQEASPLPVAELLTVEQLARKNGHTQAAPIAGDSPFTADYLVAEQLHGWPYHKLFVGGDVRLSDADYLAAIEAAKQGKTHDAAAKGGHSDDAAKKLHAKAQEESQRAKARGAK